MVTDGEITVKPPGGSGRYSKGEVVCYSDFEEQIIGLAQIKGITPESYRSMNNYSEHQRYMERILQAVCAALESNYKPCKLNVVFEPSSSVYPDRVNLVVQEGKLGPQNIAWAVKEVLGNPQLIAQIYKLSPGIAEDATLGPRGTIYGSGSRPR